MISTRRWRLPKQIADEMNADAIMVLGGGEIYRQTIDRADRLYLTEVDLAPEGDAHFPAIDPALWREAEARARAFEPSATRPNSPMSIT